MIKLLLFILITTTTLFAQNSIDIYNCYGNDHQLIVEGRLLHKREKISTSVEDSWLKNLWRKAGQLINNEIKDKKISLLIDKKKFYTLSDSEGYFSFDLNLDKALSSGYQDIKLQIEGNHVAICTVPIIYSDKKYLGIISDFDDTVVVSNVPNKIKLALNLLLKNYKQRDKVENISELYQLLLKQNPPQTPSTLFFITGSPNQLSFSIKEYLDLHNFPKRTLITKKIHGDNPDPLFDQFSYKIAKIERLINLYPNIQWYFFGDSGEKDREIYSCIAKKFPKKVKAILIRNLKTGKFENISLAI